MLSLYCKFFLFENLNLQDEIIKYLYKETLEQFNFT